MMMMMMMWPEWMASAEAGKRREAIIWNWVWGSKIGMRFFGFLG